MKIGKNVKIYGIERIIFDKKTEYNLEQYEKGKYAGVWNRTKSPRKTDIGVIPHQQMATSISAICNTKEYLVEFNGNTAHVTTMRPKRAHKKPIAVPDIMMMLVCPRHGE